MNEKRFTLKRNTISTNYPSGKIFDNKKQHSLYLDEIVDLLNELNDENQKLKQQLLYDDVCSICRHEYLVPSDDYFISKCKKEHEECSKEDTRYCKDFEIKGAKPLDYATDMFINTLEPPIIDVTNQTEHKRCSK